MTRSSVHSFFVRPLTALILSVLSITALAAEPAVTEAQQMLNDGQFDRALKRIELHLATSPQDAEARFTRGLILVKLNKTEDALKTFADLTRDYPQLPEPYNNLAVIYAQRGDYEKARDALEAALATHPSYGTAHENLGDIYSALAGAAYNRALLLDQTNQGVRAKLNLIAQLDTQERVTAPAVATGESAATVPAGTPLTEAETAAINAAVQAWAAAWSSKNLEAYFAAYAPDFKAENGLARATWEAQRRERIRKPLNIKITASDLQASRLDSQRAQVSFRQQYESDLLSNEVSKVLELRGSGSNWKIVREYTR